MDESLYAQILSLEVLFGLHFLANILDPEILRTHIGLSGKFPNQLVYILPRSTL